MRLRILFLIPVLLAIACEKENEGEPASKPIQIFEAVTSETSGLDFSNDLAENDSLNYLTYANMYMGGGVSAGDFNNDGLVDLYFTGNMVPNKLYLNQGNLKFKDITESAGVAGDGRWFAGVTLADVNNDGYLDIYCSVGGKFDPRENLLFINNGDLTFSEKAKEFGLADKGNSIQSVFFDYDRDGDLDLYVGNYPPTNFNAPNNYYAFKMSNATDLESDNLYRNDGNSFTNVTDESGLRSFGLTNSVTAGDLNNDGWPDLYVSNDFKAPDYLWINNRDGTFSEHARDLTNQFALYGMGVDIADVNNDQLLDIIQMDMTPGDNRRSKANMAGMYPDLFWGMVNAGFHYQYMQNQLQLNRGMLIDSLPVFSNISRLAGVATTDWSWGPLIADLDNDGWKDIFISNGTRREINNKDYFNELAKQRLTDEMLLEKSLAIPSEKIDNFVFRNKGDLTFEKMNEKWGLSFKGWSNGCVYADLDNDGDLEIIINNIDDKASLFENHSSEVNHFLSLSFQGPPKNPDGIGVKVKIRANGLDQYQEMTLTRGFQSSVAPRLHFGLGDANTIDTLEVFWPDGKTQQIKDLEANQFLSLDYADASEPGNINSKNDQEKLFLTVNDPNLVPSHKHVENVYDDFKYEVLLPHRTSTFGPEVSVGDLNGDGRDDFVLSGASNNQTAVYFQKENGFEKQDIKDVAFDSEFEDLGSLIFDADGDGDNDLYMVSGGSEAPSGSEFLQDRLYVNDGTGNLERSTSALPQMHTSGSRVKAFDFDKDGDLDLFIGGRLVPKNYPFPADSYLLENISEKGKPLFKDATPEIANDLQQVGMVTDAVWTDYDQDGWTDLIIVGEWMPITVLRNNRGDFQNVTKKLDLDQSNGWWFSITQEDFDHDGDPDYVLGNLGLNYKYQATQEETFDIYLNDFDKNNQNDIVLSYYDQGEKFPVRGRQSSSEQIPAIRRKFKDNDAFAVATLEDVYTKKDLERSLHYQVRSFASIYLENRDGDLVVHKLPNEAQVSSVNQVLARDVNGDDNPDLIIAGNLYGSEIETPRNDAGIGLYLQGDGQGGFTAVPAEESGLYIPGDTKDLALIKIKGAAYLIAAKNDDYLQFIKMKQRP